VQANCQCKPTRTRRARGPLASVGHSSASDSDSERPIPRDNQTKTRFNERHLSSHRRTGKGHSGCQRCSASREARLGGSCVTGPIKPSEAIRPRWMSGPGGLGPWPGLGPGGLVGQLPRRGASNSMKWQWSLAGQVTPLLAVAAFLRNSLSYSTAVCFIWRFDI
jgi:hypothetical protein